MGVPFDRIHPHQVSQHVDLEDNASVDRTFTAAAAQTAALAEGLYDVIADQKCYLKVGPVANDVAAATGYPLLANTMITLIVRKGSKIGAIRDAADGTLRYHKVD